MDNFNVRMARRFVIAVVLSWAFSAALRAECILPQDDTLCGRFAGHSEIFLGDVVAVEDVVEPEDKGWHQRVRFRILERFKGSDETERTIQFGRMAAGDFVFGPGQRVLVYGHVFGAELSTRCTSTRLFDGIGNDVEVGVLRALADRRPGGFVEGAIVDLFRNGTEVGNQSEGLTVSLRPASRPEVVISVTPRQGGSYQLGWVAPGRYEVVLAGGSVGSALRHRVDIRPGAKCVTVPAFKIKVP